MICEDCRLEEVCMEVESGRWERHLDGWSLLHDYCCSRLLNLSLLYLDFFLQFLDLNEKVKNFSLTILCIEFYDFNTFRFSMFFIQSKWKISLVLKVWEPKMIEWNQIFEMIVYILLYFWVQNTVFWTLSIVYLRTFKA